MPGEPALIGVDWGTSSFRAFLIDAAGGVVDRRSGPHGILAVTDGNFGGVLKSQIASWLKAHPLPVIMSGMIGSRQGWIETPYVTCPGGLTELAARLAVVKLDDLTIRIVPGMDDASGAMRDVMRGEETQVAGALALSDAKEGRFLLPGTHSKWVRVHGGRIDGFSTYMTGEIYAACRQHTILGRLMQDGGDDRAAFARGVRDGARPGAAGALLHRLFGVRTAGLFGEIRAAGLADYLSGLLIGAEFSDVAVERGEHVRIIAADDLARRYQAAAGELGIATELAPADCVAAGHLAIARAAGLIEARGAS